MNCLFTFRVGIPLQWHKEDIASYKVTCYVERTNCKFDVCVTVHHVCHSWKYYRFCYFNFGSFLNILILHDFSSFVIAILPTESLLFLSVYFLIIVCREVPT